MNAWIESMAELTKLGRTGFDFSFSDVRMLPDANSCCIVILFMAFCMLCAWEDRWLNNRYDHQSDMDRE